MGVMHLTADSFDDAVSSGTVLVDFWAAWCMPCTMIAPILEELAEELSGSVTVAKVDVSGEEKLAERFGVMNIPTVILFRDGLEVKRIIGVQPKEAYVAAVSG